MVMISILFPQIQMHQCAIECCRDPSKNIESLEVCNENCSKEVAAARNYVQNEFSKWQVLFSLYNLNATINLSRIFNICIEKDQNI